VENGKIGRADEGNSGHIWKATTQQSLTQQDIPSAGQNREIYDRSAG